MHWQVDSFNTSATWKAQGKWGGGLNWKLGLTDVHHYNKIDKQQGCTIYTGNYIQNPVITNNVKEFEKEYEYVRVCI